MSLEESRAAIAHQLRRRAANLLSMFDGAVFANGASPYRPLLEHAGIERADIERLVREDGVDGALARLHAAGVYVRLDELKGLVPIRRGSLELAVSPADFDNPLGASHYVARSGGSGGAPRPTLIDLTLVAHDACYFAVFLDAFEVWERPTAFWYPMPPGNVGVKVALWNSRLDRRAGPWFSQTGFARRAESLRPALLTAAMWAMSRARGRPIPFPSHTPTEQASRVAAWLDSNKRAGRPALLASTPSSAVRTCFAAEAGGLDLEGAMFRLGGEPYTPAKASVIRAAGARAAAHYSMSEAGLVGAACARPEHVDETHVALDKVALVRVPNPAGGDGEADLLLTNLLPGAPKTLINAEIGDAAVVAERDCGCPYSALGLSLHAHSIRSSAKLTSEGMTVVGSALLELVEDVLPSRFGGRPTDYQLAEVEVDGLTRVRLRVSPRVGPVDEPDVVATVLATIGSHGRPERFMAGIWGNAGTLEVVREEPRATAASKILPLDRSAA